MNIEENPFDDQDEEIEDFQNDIPSNAAEELLPELGKSELSLEESKSIKKMAAVKPNQDSKMKFRKSDFTNTK